MEKKQTKMKGLDKNTKNLNAIENKGLKAFLEEYQKQIIKNRNQEAK